LLFISSYITRIIIIKSLLAKKFGLTRPYI
jgi:hypothetical protein